MLKCGTTINKAWCGLLLASTLAACQTNDFVAGCTDPNAINYNPKANLGDSSCIYTYSKWIGNWYYIDTFTYYPPAGGPPKTTSTLYNVSIIFWNPNLMMQGFKNNLYYRAYLSGNVLIGEIDSTVFTLSADGNTITFPDGTTNSAIGYMRKQ